SPCVYLLYLAVSSLLTPRPPPPSTLFPYTTLFRSAARRQPGSARWRSRSGARWRSRRRRPPRRSQAPTPRPLAARDRRGGRRRRSEEHTSELQSHLNLVCRLLLEKKKKKKQNKTHN